MSDTEHTSAGHSIAELRELIKQDNERSKDLQNRINQLRQDIKDGKKLPKKKIDLMEVSNKDMVKDLMTRIDQIENTSMTATDREMLQALNARLTVCDIQAMRLAELRELEREARGEHFDFLEPGSEPALNRSVSDPVVPMTDELEYVEELDAGPSDKHSHELDPEHVQHSDDEVDYAAAEHHLDEVESMTTWALPYRVLRIHPETSNDEMSAKVKESVAALAMKHNPTKVPNDPDAPERWAVIEKSRDILVNADKRRFMDNSQKLPSELVGLDLAKLSLN